MGMRVKFIRLNHSTATFYDILEVSRTSNINDIKLQFKKLSKKYHPDLNSHLSEEDKKSNSDRFIRIVNAYETLKDSEKKRQYDISLSQGPGGGGGAHMGAGGRFGLDYAQNYSYNNSRKEWENKYYGAGTRTNNSRLNRTRHKVRNFGNFNDDDTTFTGQHTNYGDRYNVPHFNYQEHLLKHLKFEQRIINKQLTDEERESILKQLANDGDISDVSEELITKHLMRLVNKKDKADGVLRESINLNASNPFVYRKPNNTNGSSSNFYNQNNEYETDYDDGSTLKTVCLVGGISGSLFLTYRLVLGW